LHDVLLEPVELKWKQTCFIRVMAGLVPAIHDFIEIKMVFKSWMPATRAGMTEVDVRERPSKNERLHRHRRKNHVLLRLLHQNSAEGERDVDSTPAWPMA
jgi:hypothetical protein